MYNTHSLKYHFNSDMFRWHYTTIIREKFHTDSWNTAVKVKSLLRTHCQSHCTETPVHKARQALYGAAEVPFTPFMRCNKKTLRQKTKFGYDRL